MSPTDLDTRIRTGLAATAERVTAPDHAALVARLEHAGTPARRARHRAPGLAAAAVVAVLLVAAALAVTRSDDGGSEVATAPPSTTVAPTATGLAAVLGAGWHPLDTGPVEPDEGTALVWAGDQLVVITSTGAAWALTADELAWRPISPAPVPGSGAGITGVWTGAEVVIAIQDIGGTTSAAWDPTTDTWRDLGAVPLAPVLAEYGYSTAATWPTRLIWTGERVVDPARLAVLDPTAGGWATMPLPAGVDGSPHLLSGEMVWDGDELVWVAWVGEGLAWDARVTSSRTVPEAPVEVAGDPAVVPRARVVVAGGEVVVVGGIGPRGTDPSGGAMALDARAGVWRRLPAVPGVSDETGCPMAVAAVAGRPVVQRCDDHAVVALDGEAWVDTGAEEADAGQWLSTGGALVVWASATDTLNDPEAPYVRAWVWVPPT